MRAIRGCILVAALLLAGCAAEGPTVDGDADEGAGPLANVALPRALAWMRLPDLALPRAEHWACNFDHRIYVIGGFIVLSTVANLLPTSGVPAGGPLAPTNTVEIYDAKTNEVDLGPEYPVNIDHAPCVGYNGTIYVFGGEDSYKLEPDGTNEWQPFPPAPNPHNAGDAGIWGDRIILAGGGSTSVDVYDPETDTWTTGAAPIPTRRGHTSGDVVLGRFYMAGGDTAGHAVNTDANEEYDPVADNWTARAPVPVVRGSTQAVTWYDRLVLMGGQSGQSGDPSYDNVDVYDPVTDSWSQLPPMPAGRHGFGAAVWQDNIYVFAGAPKQDIYGFAENHALIVGDAS